jgi:hypothetical protein
MNSKPPYKIDYVCLFIWLGVVAFCLAFWYSVYQLLYQLLGDKHAASGVWVALMVLALVVEMIFVEKSGKDNP